MALGLRTKRELPRRVCCSCNSVAATDRSEGGGTNTPVAAANALASAVAGVVWGGRGISEVASP
jgi:hypothetical protein